MEGLSFLDANVFLRHIVGDEPDHAHRATALLQRVEQGDVVVCTGETVVFEVVFSLLRFYRMPRAVINEALVPLIRMPGLRIPHRGELNEAFELFLEHTRLSFADCYHAVMARRLNSPEFVSFDQGFDRLPWLNRTEPS